MTSLTNSVYGTVLSKANVDRGGGIAADRNAAGELTTYFSSFQGQDLPESASKRHVSQNGMVTQATIA